jgi:hypothetical protein
MNPLFEPGWWKRPEIVISFVAVALQTAIAQPGLLKQGTWPFNLCAYFVMLLGALGVGSSLFTAKKKKEEESPAQAQRITELETELAKARSDQARSDSNSISRAA